MQTELKKFLTIIKFDDKHHHLFENAKIVSAVYNKDTGEYAIKIQIDYIVDVRVYETFLEALKNFPTSCKVIFEVENPIWDLTINTYYSSIINRVYKNEIFYAELKRLKIDLINSKMIFTVNSEIILETLKRIKEELTGYFSQAGINYPMEFVLTSPDEIDIQNMIEDEVNKVRAEGSKERVIRVEEAKPNKDFIRNGYEKISLSELTNDDNAVEFLARIFDVEEHKTRAGKTIKSVYVTDDKASVMFKVQEGPKFSKSFIDELKPGAYVNVKGGMIYDSYARDWIFDVKKIDKVVIDDERRDDASEKRVELHLHTNMSSMDGVTAIKDYAEQALKWGHKAIAITDHGSVQSFPEAQIAAKKSGIKMIYGMEGYVVNTTITPAINPCEINLEHAKYTVFDLETTGLSTHYDAIIEFGAVKVENGIVVERKQMFINPMRKLNSFIANKTNITDDMLIGAPTIAQALPEIMAFIGDDVIVAHNASFDVGFLNQALMDNGYETIKNPVIDTVALGRLIFPELKHYRLGALSRHVHITYNDDSAHRADYDANVLADVFIIMLSKVIEKGIYQHWDLNKLTNSDGYKSAHPYHMTFLVKNAVGLKNLFKMVSMSHLEYITSVPLIPRERIDEFREGLLIGSACANGEIFEIAQTRGYEELKQAISYYDYIEVQPLANYSYLLDTEKVLSEEQLIRILKDIVKAGKEMGKIVVATGDCHYLNPRDKIFRDVYIEAKGVGGKPHPLYNYHKEKKVYENPDQHFRTTSEMIEGVSYLEDPTLIREVVITNPNKIVDMIDEVKPIKDQLFTPSLPNIDAQLEIEKLCAEAIEKKYGDKVPELVKERVEMELGKIRDNKFGVIYYLAYRLILKSHEDGYLVGSRGSVGSSFVAHLCDITEVNPLPPHYLCPHCHHSEFFTDGSVKSGYDLENKACPICGTMMEADGQNIPFETFLGIKGDKVPDIDLNFAAEYQATAHDYTKVLLGENNVFRAGTIGTVALKTAMGYAKGYLESRHITSFREAELRRLALGCTDVKRTTGQHPAGIIVVPLGMDVHDFTPIQYPADADDAAWKTTHFKFSAIHDEILKLDILGHEAPSAIRMLQDITGINPLEIPMNDARVLSLFTGISELKVRDYEILNHLGTAGVPEFGTNFVKGVLDDTKPTKFSELVQISGLTHGTDVWKGNAQDLVKQGVCELTDVIGCRDDIMVYLTEKGIDKTLAFKIMESVRKGNGLTKEMEEEMLKLSIPKWYIISCKKIKYMFPKAHAVAYVLMALRIAWFKIYHPLAYYATFFSINAKAFDIKTMIAGHDAIKNKVEQIRNMIKEKDQALTNKDGDVLETLEVALEMTARGFTFANISVTKSMGSKFVVDEEHGCLIPSIITIDGTGLSVANSFDNAKKEKPFISKEDLMARTALNSTNIKFLEDLHVLDELEEENQMSLKLF